MRALVCCLAAFVAGCATATAPVPEVVGAWGGTEASLVLADSGGSLQLQCGAGAIDGAWTMSAAGRFTATGEYYFTAGPVPIGGWPPHPAQYAGLVSGDHFTLNITVPDLSTTLGPLELVRNGPPVRQVCL